MLDGPDSAAVGSFWVSRRVFSVLYRSLEVRHEALVWAPCRLRRVADQQAYLELDQGELVVAEEELQRLEPVQAGQLQGVEDLCALPRVSEAALLHTLRVRYFRWRSVEIGGGRQARDLHPGGQDPGLRESLPDVAAL